MKKRDILKALKQDEKERNGEILEIRKEGVLYYDYGYGNEIFYRSEKYCTLEWFASRIFIGENAKKRGLNAMTIAKMVKEAYGEEFADAVCTFNSMIIFSTKKDFIKGLKFINTEDDFETLCYGMEYEEFEGCIGKMWYQYQTLLIDEGSISRMSAKQADYICGYTEEYSRGVYETILHELRHCMLDTNLFLSEEQYPVFLSLEQHVEEFCRIAYEKLSYKSKIVKIPTTAIPKRAQYA